MPRHWSTTHLVVLHHLLHPGPQHAAGHLVVPHLPQKPVRPEELGVAAPAAQLALPPAPEQGLQRSREGARQQPAEKPRGLPLFPLRRRIPGFVAVVGRGQDGDRTARVTRDDARQLLRVRVHGLGSASQHLWEAAASTLLWFSKNNSSLFVSSSFRKWCRLAGGA